MIRRPPRSTLFPTRRSSDLPYSGRHPDPQPARTGGGNHALRFESSRGHGPSVAARSEEHTSELQSLAYLVCRLLLEKKKKKDEHVRVTITYRQEYASVVRAY